MMIRGVLSGVLVCIFLGIAAASYPRAVTHKLRVDNGGQWGTWRRTQFCDTGSYATAFNQKVQEPQGLFKDDTALNAIALICTYPNGTESGIITSHLGDWGEWTGQHTCMVLDGDRFHLSRFQMQVEPPQGILDDTAANNIRFWCRSKDKGGPESAYVMEGSGGQWGHYSEESEFCPIGSSICGLEVMLEEPQGDLGDDTSLNDVTFFCCD